MRQLCYPSSPSSLACSLEDRKHFLGNKSVGLLNARDAKDQGLTAKLRLGHCLSEFIIPKDHEMRPKILRFTSRAEQSRAIACSD